jgi:uncharacterized membrane protein
MRLDDGATEADIRNWYNISLRRRTKILNAVPARVLIFTVANKAMERRREGDRFRDETCAVAR